MGPRRSVIVALVAALVVTSAQGVSAAPVGVAGVDHQVLQDSGSVVNVARISAGAPVDFRAVPALADGDGRTLERTSSMCRRASCVVAVNGDFFNAGTGNPVGGVVADGRLLRMPVDGHQQLSVLPANRFTAGALPPSAVQSLGASYTILSGGQVAAVPERSAFVTSPQPRTLIGWNGAGDTWFVTVDGGPGSAGVTLAEAGDLMRRLGATDAVNADGGGSSTFVVSGSVANRPRDGAERRVANAWVVTRRVVTTPPPVAPLPLLDQVLSGIASLLNPPR